MIELKGKYNQDCKVFVDELEPGAVELIQGILDHEISQDVPVRIMPDTHVGKGIVIGFTMPMTSMVNPNYIGVDIGCSVTSFRLNKRFKSAELPQVDRLIRQTIPLGHAIHKRKDHRSLWVADYCQAATRNVNQFQEQWYKRTSEKRKLITVDESYITILCNKVGIDERTFYGSIGSLGSGNHFIEIGQSLTDGSHYLTIHSGSRNFGLKVCNYHARKMQAVKKLPKEYHQELEKITKHTLPATDIPTKVAELNEKYRAAKKEYLLKGDDMYAYLIDMVIAQTYAAFNHQVMGQLILRALGDIQVTDRIHSMHNYIDPQDWIIRKGATSAYRGQRILIPFNMRDGVLIGEGKSNADWNYSAPHGAGRILGRNQAMKQLDLQEFMREMRGVYSSSVNKSTLDEAPMAYKDKEMIMEAIQPTVTILDSLKPLLNIKG